MKFYSWNVNGLRAALKKGFLKWFHYAEPDILCLQETRAGLDALPPEAKVVPGYHVVYSVGERKGYSGVSTWSQTKPVNVTLGFGMDPKFDCEGRIIHSDFGGFQLLNIYFPNGNKDAARLRYKLDFYEACQEYCEHLLRLGEKLIICGDVNTAHHEIDLARPKENESVSGFLPVERAWLDRFTAAGFVDVFRRLYPGTVGYTWWSQRTGARPRNIGWRLDYFFVSQNLWDQVRDAEIHPGISGSDHCPISLDLEW